MIHFMCSPNAAGAANKSCSFIISAAGLANCSVISNIVIVSTTDKAIVANCLQNVSGALDIDGNTAGGSNLNLASISLPFFVYLQGSLQIWNSAVSTGAANTALTYVDVHALRSVAGSVDFVVNIALTSVTLTALTCVALYFNAVSNVALTSLSLPVLTYVGQYLNVQNCALTVLYLPALLHLGQYLDIQLNSLASISLPVLTFMGQALILANNIALTLASIPALTFVGQYFQVSNNQMLAAINAPAMVKIACLQNECNLAGWAVYICQNAAGLSFSAAVPHAAAGNTCWLLTSLQPCDMSTVTTCQ